MENDIQQKIVLNPDAYKYFCEHIGINKLRTMFLTGQITARKRREKICNNKKI